MTQPQLATPLREAFSDYCDKRLPLGSESTFRQFEINLRRFAKAIGREPTSLDLNDTMIQRVMVGMVRSGLEPRTANKFRDNMLALWRFLCRRGDLARWPEVQPIPEPERDPVAWTREQLATLFAACEQQTGDFAGVPRRLWWHALHALGWDLGERVGGLLSIFCCDVDLDSRWVTVRAEGRKGKRADKSGRIHADTAVVLRAIWLPRREKLLPFPYEPTYLWYLYGKLLAGAGLPNDRRHKFHCLRKSSASYFEAAGGNAQQLLGHKDGRVTQRYLDPRITKTTHAADLLFRPGKTA